jgi:N-acetylmuramoyl-L-alanine amidase
MPKIDNKLKARLLDGAVEENVATMKGRLPKPLRLPRRLARKWGPRFAAVLLFLAFVGLRLTPGFGTAAAGSSAAVSTATTSPAATPAEPTQSATFPRPEKLSLAALDLGVRRIVIDAGHGGTSLGTSAVKGLHEKDVTIDIAQRLRRRLASESLTVLMTREGDQTLSLQERSELANQGRGDLFLSIHVNALTPKDRGVETYYLGTSANPSIDAIAADENRDSGYSMADLRTLVDKIYLDARKDESRRFAESVQRALLRDLRRVNPALEDRGVKTAPFVVLVGTRMPAILAEVSCLSNDEEAELLGGESYRQSIADALFDGIHAYLREGVPGGRRETRHGS